MDRRAARRNISNGLTLALGAAVVFAIAFIAANLYIAAS